MFHVSRILCDVIATNGTSNAWASWVRENLKQLDRGVSLNPRIHPARVNDVKPRH